MEFKSPVPMPTGEPWDTAVAEYYAGRVMRLTMNDRDGVPTTAAATVSWLKTWRNLSLTTEEKIMVRTACIQINKGRIHPALGKTRLLGEPVGCWQVAIHPDILVTWIGHWREREIPVLLTLEREAPEIRN